MSPFDNESVKIDIAHRDLIYGLVVSAKPKNILELGLGGGRSADAIIDGIDYNQNDAKFTIVDNWFDTNFKMPEGVAEKYSNVNIVSSSEESFVLSGEETFDFIFSDADHFKADQWFEYVFECVLEQGGILIYHDINLFEDAFPNLRKIYQTVLKRKLSHFLFNKNSFDGERCHRGMLVIFKN